MPVVVAGEHQGYLDEIRISWGDGPLGRGPTGRCLRTGTTQVAHDFTPDPDYKPWLAAANKRGFQCSISLPVRVDDTIDGALMVYATEHGAFDDLARNLLEDLAADLGYGIGRLRTVADLVRATDEAQAQRERLQATFDSQFDPFILLEAVRDDDGTLVDLRYVEANAAAVAYNGLPREKLIGTRLLDLYPGQLENGPLKLYFTAIETSVPVILDDYRYGNERLASDRHYDIRAMRSGDGIALTWRDVTDRHLSSQRLAESQRRYRLLAENSSDVVILSDRGMNLNWVSPSARQAFGLDPALMVGHGADEFIHPDDLPGLRSAVVRSDADGQPARVRYRWRCADGGYRWVEAAGRPIDDDGTGQPGRVVGLRDIDAQVRAEQDLATREEHYRLLAENASDVVWQISPDGGLAWTSPSVTQILGWRPEQILGQPAMDLIHADDRVRAIANREDLIAGRSHEGGGEFRLRRADGSSRWMSLSVRPVPTPTGVVRIVALRDIDDEVAARQRLEFSLEHDLATGLETRRVLLTRIEFHAYHLRRGHEIGALCVGIDSLSQVNEALTHAAGDLVMTTVAARVAAAATRPDLVGRGSGDEFLVILPDLDSGSDAAEEAERIRLAVQGPMHIAGEQISPTVSIGIATGGRDVDAEQLLRDASLAMRKAKNNGRDRWEFADPGLAVEAQRRLSVENEIRRGLREGQFVPWFQPLVSLGEDDVVGYESLIRWVREGDVLLPADFLPIAERSSLINEIDAVALSQSLAVLARLPEPLFVAVNVTASTLTRMPYADMVLAALAESGADPRRLHLEITETMLLNLTRTIPEAMRRLADIGIRWYVDDFGTGYSSISHLRDLPVAGLKLDLSFTRGIGAGDRTSMQLAGALIGLANGLSLDTVAEGVETQAEADYLRTLGWRHAQGWLYGKAQPLPLPDPAPAPAPAER